MQLGAARGWHDDDDGLPLVHQGDGAVLELAGGESLGVDVADFLEFEGALEGDGESDVTAQVDDGGRVLHRAGELADRLAAVEDAGDGLGDARELVHVVGDLVGVLVAAHLRQVQAQDVAGGDLRGEGLRGGDRDLGARVGEDDGVRLARDRRAGRIHDGDDFRALLAGVADRLNGVHGFAALRDGDDQRLLADDGVAVAELAGEFDLDGDAAPVLDRVAGDLARVGGGAAADHDDLVDGAQDVLGDAHLVEGQVAVGVDAVGQGGTHGFGLLVDFLLHEGRPAVLGGAVGGEVDLVFLGGDGRSVGVDDGHVGRGDDDDLVLSDLDGAVGVLDKGQDVGAQEVLALAQADDQRGGAARRDDNVGRLVGDDKEREGAVQLGGDRAHGDDEAAGDLLVRAGEPGDVPRVRGRLRLVVGAGQQVDDHLGVGLGGEGLAVGDEGGTQGVRVLDDAVVNEGEAPVGAGVGVSVGDRGAPVGGPAGVSDAGVGVGGAVRVDFFDEVDELTDRAAHVQALIRGQGDARRVVAAVLQAREAAKDHLAAALGGLTSDVSNNSAHGTNSSTPTPPAVPNVCRFTCERQVSIARTPRACEGQYSREHH